MSTDAFDRAAALVRAWTWLYTWTVSPDLRERRRKEIAADLWDAAHDPHAASPIAIDAEPGIGRQTVVVRADLDGAITGIGDLHHGRGAIQRDAR